MADRISCIELLARVFPISLAFRKGQAMSDADWESLWDDMVESGLIGDEKTDG